MGHRTKLIDGAEYDAISTPWRHMIVLSRGYRRYNKRKIRRRERKLAKEAMRRED